MSVRTLNVNIGCGYLNQTKYMCGRLDNLFEAAGSGNNLAHPHITTNIYIYIYFMCVCIYINEVLS